MYPGVSLWLLSLLATSLAGDPSVSWGDWIIVDETEPGTSILLRRITPKSVFVAPTFNGCSEGYRQDSLGRCVKLVKVNQQAQWNFFLERLNSMYAPASSSKNPQKEAGPFHINLPLGSESSQEDTGVKKRLPPKIREESVKTKPTSTTTQSTTTKPTLPPPTKPTLPPPTKPTLPPTRKATATKATTTTVQESTTQEVTQPTMVDTSEVTSTDRESTFQPESTTDSKRDVTTDSSFDTAVMLGDQPVSTEDFAQSESLETPKNLKKTPTQLPQKPFVIIVTNEPTTRTEETTNVPTTSFTPLTTQEEDEDTYETPSTTEVTTEATTETIPRYSTEAAPKTTEYDESFSETRDSTETSIRPTVRYHVFSTVRPKCDSQSRDDLPSDCEPAETEIVSEERDVTNPSVSLPASLPLLEPNTRVRFPSESFVPVRKTQSFVRFPEVTRPHDDRPSYWWPSWQIRQHPGIRGWPPSEEQPSDHKQYPAFSQSWADSNAWRRRFFQRD